MKKVLLHFVESIRPGGGASGYVHNLKYGLEKADILGDIIDVLTLSMTNERLFDQKPGVLAQKLKPVLNTIGSSGTIRLLLLRQFIHWKRDLPKEVYHIVSQYQCVVFHSPSLAFRYLNKNFPKKQKVFVMLHPPTNSCVEQIDGWKCHYGESKFADIALRKLASLELNTFLKTNGVIVPHKTGINAYFDFDTQMKEVFLNQVLTYEIPSGVPPLVATKTTENVRQELGISEDKIVVGFFGRYHPHKGFDIFVDAAKLASNHNLPIQFIAAGAGPIQVPEKMPNFINLGWRKDIANALIATDVIIIPNRETNFDLLALEAMSIGKAIIASSRGGNIYLASTSEGVQLFEDVSSVGLIRTILKSTKEKLQYWGNENLKVYQEKYNIDAFVCRHISLANKLLES